MIRALSNLERDGEVITVSEKIVIFKDTYPLIDILSFEDRGKILTACYIRSISPDDKKALDEVLSGLDKYGLAIWKQMQDKIDYQIEHDKEISEKRSEAGKKAHDKKQLSANAGNSKQVSAPCTTYTNTYTNTNTKQEAHAIGTNGKPFRIDEYGKRRWWDTGDLVPENYVWKDGDKN